MIARIFEPEPTDLGLAVKTAYASFLTERFGLRLTEAQAKEIIAAIPPLLATTAYATPLAMLDAIASDHRSDLLGQLVSRVTIGETHFFRVAPQIEALRHVVLPDIISRRQAERQVHLWSAGCSTGEEPYTLAILIREHLPQFAEWDVRLLATDINETAITTAMVASYGEWSFRDTPELARASYFTQIDKRWTVVEPIRRLVRFSRLNLVADPFPSPDLNGPNLDLIVCRNVTIYFEASATQRLYARFAEGLVPGGWLLLGPSDPVPEQSGPFEPVHTNGAVVWRRRAPKSSPTEAQLASRHTMVDKSGPGSAGVSPARSGNDGGPSKLRARAPSRNESKPIPADIERYLLAHPLDADAHLRLGMIYLERDDVDRAIGCLRRATFLNPDNALAHFGRGRACLRLDDRAGALAALTRARSVLAAMPDDRRVPGGDGITANELRRAVDIQFSTLSTKPATRTTPST